MWKVPSPWRLSGSGVTRRRILESPGGRRLLDQSLVTGSNAPPTLARRRPLIAQQVHHCTLSTSTTNNNNNNNNNNTDSEPGKFAMPDQDMELKLVQIQTTVSQHYQRGDYSKALALSKDLFQQSQKHFGQDHPAVASALNNVGLMQKQLGDFIEARRHYNAALRIYSKVVGRDHASYAMTLHNLASLNKAQVHFDTSLKATERLSLVETALDYFEEALAIRRSELGPDHPLTIATQSSLGTTLADQVLNQHRQVKDGQHKYVSLNPEAVTQQGWEAAEHHLRQAVQMAISKPRGKSIHNNKSYNNNNNKAKKGTKKTAGGTKVASSSLAASPITNEDSSSSLPASSSVTPVATVETLSAASAAQNLAVFLKSRAMTYDPYHSEMMDEARSLYQQVLQVRSQLLPNPQHHPDLLATKFSLAELLQIQGDEEAANAIRQEILDDYDDDDPSDEAKEQSSLSQGDPIEPNQEQAPKMVMVEQTKGRTIEKNPI